MEGKFLPPPPLPFSMSPPFPAQLWAAQCLPRPHRGRLIESLDVSLTQAPYFHSRDAYNSVSAFLTEGHRLRPLIFRFLSQNSDCWRQASVFFSEPTLLVLVQNPVPVALQQQHPPHPPPPLSPPPTPGSARRREPDSACLSARDSVLSRGAIAFCTLWDAPCGGVLESGEQVGF